MNYFVFVPEEIISLIAVFGSVQNIAIMRLLCERFNNIIWTNNFWKQKFTYDYGPLGEMRIISWLSAYQNYNTIVFGSNKFGQLGIGNTESNNISWGDRSELNAKLGDPINLYNPTLLPANSRFTGKAKAVCCGQLYSTIIDLKDRLWSFGENEKGQLGIWSNLNEYTPKKTAYTARIVSCGYAHTMIIDEANLLWASGNNNYGELGLEDNNERSILDTIGIEAKAVSCGENHSIIIDMEDKLWSCGRNLCGQLGLGNTQDQNKFISAESKIAAKMVACGGYHSIIVDSDNNIWACGNNLFGQLGLGDIVDRHNFIKLRAGSGFAGKPKMVACGGFHTIIIDTDGNVWAFGQNSFGQLGLGDTVDVNVPTKITFPSSARFVSCGYLHTMIIDTNNHVWVFGCNTYNQLGLGDIEDRYSPVLLSAVSGLPDTAMKACSVSCGVAHSIIILDPNPEFGSNVYLISLKEAQEKVNFCQYEIKPEYQIIPHSSETQIASFEEDGNIYLVEINLKLSLENS